MVKSKLFYWHLLLTKLPSKFANNFAVSLIQKKSKYILFLIVKPYIYIAKSFCGIVDSEKNITIFPNKKTYTMAMVFGSYGSVVNSPQVFSLKTTNDEFLEICVYSAEKIFSFLFFLFLLHKTTGNCLQTDICFLQNFKDIKFFAQLPG